MMARALQIGRSFSWLQTGGFAFSAITAIGSKVLAACLTFLLGILLARALGYTAYGEYAFVLAIIQLIAIVSKCGLDNTALRYAAEYRAANKREALGVFLRDVAKVNLLVSCGVATIVASVAWLFRSQLSTSMLFCYLLGAALLAILPISQVREATLVAMGKVSQGIVGPALVPAVFIALLLLFQRFAPFDCTSSAAMFLHLLAALVGLFVASRFLTRVRRSYLIPEQQRTTKRKEWKTMAFSMMLVNVLVYILGQSGTIFSGAMLGTEQAGLYSAATRISGASLLGLSSINMIAAPRMAALYSAGDRYNLQRIAKLCTWGSFALALPIVLLTAFYGKSLLLFYGAEFVAGYATLLVLLIGLVVNASTGSAAHLLYMTGYHSTCLRIYGVVAVITVTLHVCLISTYGVLGAALTTLIAQFVWNLALVFHVRKKIGVWSLVGFSAVPTHYLNT